MSTASVSTPPQSPVHSPTLESPVETLTLDSKETPFIPNYPPPPPLPPESLNSPPNLQGRVQREKITSPSSSTVPIPGTSTSPSLHPTNKVLKNTRNGLKQVTTRARGCGPIAPLKDAMMMQIKKAADDRAERMKKKGTPLVDEFQKPESSHKSHNQISLENLLKRRLGTLEVKPIKIKKGEKRPTLIKNPFRPLDSAELAALKSALGPRSRNGQDAKRYEVQSALARYTNEQIEELNRLLEDPTGYECKEVGLCWEKQHEDWLGIHKNSHLLKEEIDRRLHKNGQQAKIPDKVVIKINPKDLLGRSQGTLKAVKFKIPKSEKRSEPKKSEIRPLDSTEIEALKAALGPKSRNDIKSKLQEIRSALARYTDEQLWELYHLLQDFEEYKLKKEGLCWEDQRQEWRGLYANCGLFKKEIYDRLGIKIDWDSNKAEFSKGELLFFQESEKRRSLQQKDEDLKIRGRTIYECVQKRADSPFNLPDIITKRVPHFILALREWTAEDLGVLYQHLLDRQSTVSHELAREQKRQLLKGEAPALSAFRENELKALSEHAQMVLRVLNELRQVHLKQKREQREKDWVVEQKRIEQGRACYEDVATKALDIAASREGSGDIWDRENEPELEDVLDPVTVALRQVKDTEQMEAMLSYFMTKVKGIGEKREHSGQGMAKLIDELKVWTEIQDLVVKELEACHEPKKKKERERLEQHKLSQVQELYRGKCLFESLQAKIYPRKELNEEECESIHILPPAQGDKELINSLSVEQLCLLNNYLLTQLTLLTKEIAPRTNPLNADEITRSPIRAISPKKGTLSHQFVTEKGAINQWQTLVLSRMQELAARMRVESAFRIPHLVSQSLLFSRTGEEIFDGLQMQLKIELPWMLWERHLTDKNPEKNEKLPRPEKFFALENASDEHLKILQEAYRQNHVLPPLDSALQGMLASDLVLLQTYLKEQLKENRTETLTRWEELVDKALKKSEQLLSASILSVLDYQPQTYISTPKRDEETSGQGPEATGISWLGVPGLGGWFVNRG